MVANKYGPGKGTKSVSFRNRIETTIHSSRKAVAQDDVANTTTKSVSSPSSRSARREWAIQKRLRTRHATVAGTGARPTNPATSIAGSSSRPEGKSTSQQQQQQQKQHEGPTTLRSTTPPPPPPTSTPPMQQKSMAVGSVFDNTPGSPSSASSRASGRSYSTYSNLSNPSESGRPSRFSGASPSDQQQLAKLKLRKNHLYSKLKEYEISFENQNGRQVRGYEDIEPVKDLYKKYLDTKAEYISCKKAVRNRQARVNTTSRPDAEVSRNNSRSVGSTTAWYDCGAFGAPWSPSPPAAACTMDRITDSPKEDEEGASGGFTGREKEFVNHANDNVGKDELKEDMLIPQDQNEAFTLQGAEEYKEGYDDSVVDAPDDEMGQPPPTSKGADNSTPLQSTLPPTMDDNEVVVSAVAAILDYDKRRKGSAESVDPKVEGGTVEQNPSKPARSTGTTIQTMVTPSPRRPKSWREKTQSKGQQSPGGADAVFLEGTVSVASTPSRTPMSPPVIDRTVHRIPGSARRRPGRKLKPAQIHPFEPPNTQSNSASAVAGGSDSPIDYKLPPSTNKKPTYLSQYDNPGDIVMIPGEETSSFCKVEERSDESISSKESSSSQPGKIVINKSHGAAVASCGVPSAPTDVFRKAQYASLPFDEANPNDGFTSMASNSLINQSLGETGPFTTSYANSAQIAGATVDFGLNTNHHQAPSATNLLRASGQDKTPDRMQPSPENENVNGEDESPTCVSSLTVPKEHPKNKQMPLMPIEKLAPAMKAERRSSNSTFSSVQTPPRPNLLGLDCAVMAPCVDEKQRVSPLLSNTESVDDDFPSMARMRQRKNARASTNDKNKVRRTGTSNDPPGRTISAMCHFKPSDDDIGSISDGEMEVPDSRAIDKVFRAEKDAAVKRKAAGFSPVPMHIGREEDRANTFVVDLADKTNKAAPSFASEEMTEITLDATFDDLPSWTKMVDDMVKSIEDGSIYEQPPTEKRRKPKPAVAALTPTDDSEHISASVQKDAGESKLALALQELDVLKNDFASIAEELDHSKDRLKRLEAAVEEKDEIISLVQLERKLAQADVKHLREEIHRMEQSSRAKEDEELTDIPCTSPSCTTCDAKDKEIESLRAALEEAKKKSDDTNTMRVPEVVPQQMPSDGVPDSIPSDEESENSQASSLVDEHASPVSKPIVGDTEVSVDAPSTPTTKLTSDSKRFDGSRFESITEIIPDNANADESIPSDDTEVRNALISQFQTKNPGGNNRALALDICRRKHPERISSHNPFDEFSEDEETASNKDDRDSVKEALDYFHSFAIDVNNKKDEGTEESEDKDTSEEKVQSRYASIVEESSSSSDYDYSEENEDGSSGAADETTEPLKDESIKDESSAIFEETDKSTEYASIAEESSSSDYDYDESEYRYGSFGAADEIKGPLMDESSAILEETDNLTSKDAADTPGEVAQAESKDLVELFRATSSDHVEGSPTMDEEDTISGGKDNLPSINETTDSHGELLQGTSKELVEMVKKREEEEEEERRQAFETESDTQNSTVDSNKWMMFNAPKEGACSELESTFDTCCLSDFLQDASDLCNIEHPVHK